MTDFNDICGPWFEAASRLLQSGMATIKEIARKFGLMRNKRRHIKAIRNPEATQAHRSNNWLKLNGFAMRRKL